ncbi:reverse transcriptase domain-containing protein [Tanacetum coccineum]
MLIRDVSLFNLKLETECYLRYLRGKEWYDLVRKENWHHVPLDEIEIDENLRFVEEPIEIVERDVKKLKRRRIPLVKVRWNSRQGAEYTWEREDQFRKRPPQCYHSAAYQILGVLHEVPAKIEDPGLFTLPCRLRGLKPFNTLADLGSCVNIIPLYLFKKFNIGLLEETNHIFWLADGTKSYPIRIVKDVEVHIRKLKLLNDFYVIDMKKDPKTPLLVGRGFLATANAIIDCRMAKIAVGKGITISVFGVKRVDLGEEEASYWTTLGKRNHFSQALIPLVDPNRIDLA